MNKALIIIFAASCALLTSPAFSRSSPRLAALYQVSPSYNLTINPADFTHVITNKPGILMLNNPEVGDTYRLEYYQGKAEEMGTVVAVGKNVTVPRGAFEDCVQIRDWSRIKGESAHKYHCTGAGLVLEEKGRRAT